MAATPRTGQRLALWRWTATLAALMCAAAACQPSKPTAVRDLAGEARALLQGLGPTKNCLSDMDCALGATKGACAVGTCLGLFTADQRPLRRVLLERIGHTDAPLRALVRTELLRVAALADSGHGLRLASTEGLGTALRVANCRDDAVRTALVATLLVKDPTVAATARLGLGRCGDAAALPGLLEDAKTGSELLRAESSIALAGYPGDAGAASALLALLDDPSPVVQRAALLALGDGQSPQVAAHIQRTVHQRAPHLAYLLGKRKSELKP